MANNQKYTIQFDAQLQVNQIKQAVANIQSSLNGLKIPDKMLGPFSKDLTRLESEIRKFEALSSKSEFDKTGLNELVKSYNVIDKLTREIGIDIKGITKIDLTKLLPEDALNRFEKLQSILDNIASIGNAKSNLATEITELTQKQDDLTTKIEESSKALEDFQAKQKQAVLDKLGADEVTKKIQQEIRELKKAQEDLIKARQNIPAQIQKNEEEIVKKQKAIAKLREEAEKIQQTIDKQKAYSKQTGKPTSLSQLANEQSVEKKNEQVTALEEEIRLLQKENRSLKSQKTDATQLSVYKQREQAIAGLTEKLAEAKIKENEYANAVTKANRDVANTSADLERYKAELAEINEKLTQLKQIDVEGTKLQEFRQQLAEILQQDISTIPTNLEDLKKVIESLQTDQLAKVNAKLKEITQSSEQATQASQELGGEVEKEKKDFEDFDDRARDVSALKTRIQYFFGLNNAINLFRRAIRQAFNTIKELDKAMTETAVVTDFTVSDMWEQLPEYTKRANELGVTTLSAYQAATLYYQQGLKTNEVNALSVETLKMARIAGLEAAEATDRMTNALRGFNMELTEANAQRVDDVYSELAANTASNVDEISTAMTKVASLAHNANMEFETTAAFLAQIIETTRESAETAGTALKTVVARFSEVKKLVDQNQLRGEDEEGQAIDVNKVGAALRTAGIDLNKYFIGEVGLDDIFMELASKWDSLTSIQQRYIATQAAGSRQQSRFIALMQDYARTQELVGKAYNANGAAARQFAKTQESLESKLNRLKNAWNEFLMGLTNNTLVKTFVDLLTDLLNVVNKLTSAFGDGAGSIMKWGVALGAIYGGKKIFNAAGFDNLLSIFSGKRKGATQKNVASNILWSSEQQAFTQSGQKNLLFNTLLSSIKERRGKRISAFNAISSTGGALGAEAGLLGKLGANLSSKGIGSRFAKTGAASKLASLLGFGDAAGGAAMGAAGASAAAGLAVSLAGVALAVGAIYGAWRAFSPEGKLKTAEKAAEKAKKQTEDAKKSLESLQSFEETYKNAQEKVENTTTAKDRQQAVEERNQAVLEAIKEDGTLAKYVVTEVVDNEIEITVNEEKLAEAIKNASDTLKEAEIKTDFANATVDLRQADVYESTLRSLWLSSQTTNGTTAKDYAGIELSPEEYLNQILDSTAIQNKPELAAKATEMYKNIIGARANAEKTAEYAYAQRLQGLTKNNDLINALIPMLGEAFKETNKQLSNEQLKSIIGVDNIENLAKVYSGKVEGINLRNANIENEIELYKTLGITEDQLETLATITGLDIKAIKSHIKTVAEDTKQIQLQQVANIYQKAWNSGIFLTKDMQNKIGELPPEITELFSNILDQATDSITQQGMGELINAMLDMDSESLEQIQSFYQNFNLDQPIQAFHQLKQAEEGALELPEAFKNLLPQIRAANSALFNTGNLVQSFLLSDSYDSITESVSEFIEENGKLSASNIEELADSCLDLKTILDDTTVTAEGLAEAFSGYENGKIAIDGITTALLEAFSAGESFETLLGKVNDWIEDFNKGTDLTEGTTHIVSIIEELTEYVTKWQFGNETTENIYDHLFGKEAYDKFMNGRWGPDKSVDEIAKAMQNQIDKLSGLAENNGLGFMQQVVQSGLGERLHITQLDKEGYNFNWDLSSFENAQQVIEQVQIALKQLTGAESVSEDTARAFIEGVGAQFYDMRQQWNELNYKGELEAFAKSIKDNSVITKSELEALGAATGKTAEKVLDDLKEIAGETITIPVMVNWSDDEGGGLTGTELIDRFNEKFSTLSTNANGETVREYGNLLQGIFDEASGYINADVLMQRLTEELKLNPSQAEEIANNITEEVSGQLTKEIQVPVFETLPDGTIEVSSETITIKADSMEGLTYAADVALAGANTDSIGQALANGNYDAFKDVVQKAIEAAGSAGASAVKGSLESIKPVITIDWKWGEKGPPTNTTGAEMNTNAFNVRAKGGIVRSLATGSSDHFIQPGFALTGEEGAEIVWNKEKGYAYVTGRNGPQFQNLQPGDRVFNAQETDRIFRNSSFANGRIIGSWANGGWNASAINDNNSGGSGSGKDKEKEEKWKNEVDWLYNLVEDIAELERIQTKLQEDYEDYLIDDTKTSKDLYNLLIQQLGNLYTQLDHQTFALEKREQEMREFMDTTNKYDDYLWYNWEDRTLEIDWDQIEAIKASDKETYDEIVDLISEAESIQDKMDDAEDSVMDIKNQIQELENIWRDTFTDFEERVYSAIVKAQQTVIDNYSDLNDTLNNSNSEILNALQKQISLERQIRDNTKTEEELADTEAQLAFLRRDTSGGNELAALQLEKQLSDDRQSYEDNLIDQAISRLQEDNDAAAQQREHQIEIMQAQLDYQSQSGEFNAQVLELLNTAMGADGELLTNSDLVDLLKTQENWSAMSDVSKQVWDEELNTTFKEVAAFLLKQNAEENGTFVTALTGALGAVNATIGSYSQGMMKYLNSSSSSGGGGRSSKNPYIVPDGNSSDGDGVKGDDISADRGCFAAGTKILMADHSIKSIECVKDNDIVIAYDENSNTFVPKQVVHSYIHHNTLSMVRIYLSNGIIMDMTPGHPIFTTTGWKSLNLLVSLLDHQVEATLLHTGDTIVGINGNNIVTNIEFYKPEINYDTYNLEVADCHTFLANGQVVHNVKISLKEARWSDQFRFYATGGLNTQTGPAWLDGTASEPEYVLNARQTDAFLRLADVLPNIMSNSGSVTNTFGGVNLNLVMNVDQIASDYDVDRIADKVKEIVYDAGSYRNVNTLNFSR